jgi:hypothetical protein
LERREEEEEEEKETEAREVRKRGRCCCCCFQGVVWARVAVVVIISLYILSILRKKEFVLVSFFGVFLVNFFWREIFFFSFFCTFFVKNTTNTFDFRQTHTTKQRSAEVVCVSARVCGVIVV